MSKTPKDARTVWERFNQVSALIIALLVLATVIITCIFVAKQDSTFRICFRADASQVVGGVGEAGAVVHGMITMDANSNTIKYEARSSTGMTATTALHIRGPMQLASPQIGPIYIALCGSPNLGTCDTTTVAGEFKGTVTTIYDGVLPEATDVRTAVEQLRREPFLYYIEGLTNAKPTSPGAYRAAILGTCGFE